MSIIFTSTVLPAAHLSPSCEFVSNPKPNHFSSLFSPTPYLSNFKCFCCKPNLFSCAHISRQCAGFDSSAPWNRPRPDCSGCLAHGCHGLGFIAGHISWELSTERRAGGRQPTTGNSSCRQSFLFWSKNDQLDMGSVWVTPMYVMNFLGEDRRNVYVTGEDVLRNLRNFRLDVMNNAFVPVFGCENLS